MIEKAYPVTMNAMITRKDGTRFNYNVFTTYVNILESDRFTTEEEIISCFYNIIDKNVKDSWNYSKIDLDYIWNKDHTTTTIYG